MNEQQPRLTFVGMGVASDQRVASVEVAMGRAHLAMSERLHWPGLPQPIDVMLELGPFDPDRPEPNRIEVRETTRLRGQLMITVGIPIALLPENTPAKHVNALRLMLDVVDVLVAELKVPYPKLRGDDAEIEEPAMDGQDLEGLLDDLVDEEGSFLVAKRVDLHGPRGRRRAARAEAELRALVAPEHRDRIIASEAWEWGLSWEITGEPAVDEQ